MFFYVFFIVIEDGWDGAAGGPVLTDATVAKDEPVVVVVVLFKAWVGVGMWVGTAVMR